MIRHDVERIKNLGRATVLNFCGGPPEGTVSQWLAAGLIFSAGPVPVKRHRALQWSIAADGRARPRGVNTEAPGVIAAIVPGLLGAPCACPSEGIVNGPRLSAEFEGDLGGCNLPNSRNQTARITV